MPTSVTSPAAIRRTALDEASCARKEDISHRGNVGARLVMRLKHDGPSEPKIRKVVQNFADATIRERSSGGTSPVMERNTTLSERTLSAPAATQDPVSPPASTFAGASRVREPEITASPSPPQTKTSHPVTSELTDRRPAALLDNLASKRRVWPGDKPLTPPAQRPLTPDSAGASSRAASSLDQYDINVIVLTASDNTMTAAAQALSKKYPRKTLTLGLNGKIVADDIPGFREGGWSPPFHSKVKLQVLGYSRLAPMTGPGVEPGAAAQMMTVGGQSGGALGEILPDLLKKKLGISLTDACLNTSFVTCGSSGERLAEVGLEKAFVEAYVDGLRQGGQVSLVNNFVSIHTAEVAVAADGTKYTRRIGSDVEQIGENTWVTTEREKRVYRYSASNIDPLGLTPVHYSKTALIDYAKKRQHMKFAPNPKSFQDLIDRAGSALEVWPRISISGGMFYYKLAPNGGLQDVTQTKRAARLKRLGRSDVAPFGGYPAALHQLNNLASKRRVWSGDKPLTPPAQRPLRLDSAGASSRAASSLDQYDINVIVLTASDSTTTAAAQALSIKYPGKTLTLDLNGKIVADDFPGFREGEWSPPFHSKVKLQVLGHSRLAPMTEPGGAPGAAAHMMTIGGQSGGALGEILPVLLKENLGISLTDACLNTSFVTCGSSGESSTEVGLEKAFVEAYTEGLRQGGQVSLVNNFVSIHTAEVAVAADGTKYTRRIGSDAEQIGKNTWVTTESEKRVYRYSASNIDPLGLTPAHYSKTVLIDYAKERQHMKFAPNPKNLTIYVMSQQDWLSMSAEMVFVNVFSPQAYHQGEGRTLFFIYGEDGEILPKCAVTDANISINQIDLAEAKTVVAEARERGQTQFDLVLQGDGNNTISGLTGRVNQMDGTEWASLTKDVLKDVGAEGMTIHNLSLYPCYAAGAPFGVDVNDEKTPTTHVHANPRFPSDLVGGLLEPYMNGDTIISAAPEAHSSHPPHPTAPSAPFDGVCFTPNPEQKAALYALPVVIQTVDARLSHYYQISVEAEGVIYLLGRLKLGVASIDWATRPSFQDLIDQAGSALYVMPRISISGGMFYYKLAPNGGLQDVTQDQRAARLKRLGRSDVAPFGGDPAALQPLGDARSQGEAGLLA